MDKWHFRWSIVQSTSTLAILIHPYLPVGSCQLPNKVQKHCWFPLILACFRASKNYALDYGKFFSQGPFLEKVHVFSQRSVFGDSKNRNIS